MPNVNAGENSRSCRSFKLKDLPEHDTNTSRNLYYSTSPAPSRSNSAGAAVDPPERSLSPSPLVRPEHPEASPFGDGRREEGFVL